MCSIMNTRPGPDADTVTLGLLPHPPRTRSDRVAHPRPGFIAPTSTAVGDAPPIHATQPVATIRSTASTTGQQQPTAHSFTANTRLVDAVRIDRTPRLPSWVGRLPWSFVLAVAAFGLIQAAQQVTGASSAVAVAALAAVVVCGVLLVVAQTIGQVQRR